MTTQSETKTEDTEQVQPGADETTQGTTEAPTIEGLEAELTRLREERDTEKADIERGRQRNSSDAGNIRSRRDQDEAIKDLAKSIKRLSSRVDLSLDQQGADPEEFEARRQRLTQEEREAQSQDAFQRRSTRHIERINQKLQKAGIDPASDPRFNDGQDMFGKSGSTDDLDDARAFVDDVIEEILEKRRDDELKKVRDEGKEEGLSEGRTIAQRADDTNIGLGRTGGGAGGTESLEDLSKKDTRFMNQGELREHNKKVDDAFRRART